MLDPHGGSPAAEQFEDYAKQVSALRLGMWVFLGSETLLFAGLFGLYAAYRRMYTPGFVAAVDLNSAVLGTSMTVILLVSSFAIAWSLYALRRGRRGLALACLGVTLSLGLLFIGLKAHEYLGHFAHGIFPAIYYDYADLPGAGPTMFFTLYFFMTGLHALHVVAGMIILGWMGVAIIRRRVTAERNAPLEMGALYWHLVDIVWIFLWPLLYLTG